MNDNSYRAYLVTQEQRDVLKGICDRLHNGNDAMRDEGHRLWMTLVKMKDQAVTVTQDGEVQ